MAFGDDMNEFLVSSSLAVVRNLATTAFGEDRSKLLFYSSFAVVAQLVEHVIGGKHFCPSHWQQCDESRITVKDLT